MRITNPMVSRNYTRNLHSNRGLLDSLSNKVYSGREFNKMSEDTASGVRAMQVRRSLSRIEGYMDNAQAAVSQLGAAEATLMQISEITHSASERFVQAINGDNGNGERDVIANELEKLRDELLSLANGRFADRYMFGGTNVVTAPFTVGNDGKLLYNNVPLAQAQDDPVMQEAAYMDIGLGLRFTDEIDPTQVDPNSAFKHTLVGADFIGTGDDNLYGVLTEMIDHLRAGKGADDASGDILDRFRKSSANVNIAITKLGADSQQLEFTIGRLETEKINLYERQTQLEAADPAEAIMNFKMQEYAYNASLQMGSRLLQPNLFSFLS